jgi:hypothetical protein
MIFIDMYTANIIKEYIIKLLKNLIISTNI